jgi:hypothetical protein
VIAKAAPALKKRLDAKWQETGPYVPQLVPLSATLKPSLILTTIRRTKPTFPIHLNFENILLQHKVKIMLDLVHRT